MFFRFIAFEKLVHSWNVRIGFKQSIANSFADDVFEAKTRNTPVDNFSKGFYGFLS